MTEADLQRLVTDAAELYGWSWAHFRPAQTARGWRTPVSGPIGRGFPDLIMVRGRDKRLMFVELKADKGVMSTYQDDVIGQLVAAGQTVHIVRPQTFDAFLEELQ
jgi:hypothetical protein